MNDRREKLYKVVERARQAGFTDAQIRGMMFDARKKEKKEANVATGDKTVVVDFRTLSGEVKDLKHEQANTNKLLEILLHKGVEVSNFDDIEPKDSTLAKSSAKDLNAIRGNLGAIHEKAGELQQEAVKSRKEILNMGQLLVGLFSGFTQFISGLVSKSVFKIQPTEESFTTPQMSVLYDPATKSVMSISQIMDFIANTRPRVSVSVPRLITETNSASILAAILAQGGGGATSVGQGNGTVTTAGTAVQLSAISVPCTRVVIYNHPDNGAFSNNGILAVGNASVVAASATRTGAMIFPSNGMEFKVSNLNLLYIDATDNGCKFNYYYEV